MDPAAPARLDLFGLARMVLGIFEQRKRELVGLREGARGAFFGHTRSVRSLQFQSGIYVRNRSLYHADGMLLLEHRGEDRHVTLP